MGLNIPAGVKMIGANLVPNPNVAFTANRRFEGMWSSERDWEGWIKPQIDYLIGNCGCNCIRSIGGHYGVSGGRVSAATYLANQLQVANYLASKGAYYYPCGDSARPDTDYATTAAAQAAIYAAYLIPLQGVGNVIGFDICNEGEGSSFSIPYMTTLIAGLKAAGVVIPLTYSRGQNAGHEAWLTARRDLFDYIDVHTYKYAVPTTYLDDYLINTSKDVIISEVGTNTKPLTSSGGGTASEQTANLGSAYDLALGGNPRIKGVLQWACADLESAATSGDPQSGEWGVFDTNTTVGTFIARYHKVAQIRRKTRGSCALSKAI